MHFKIKNVGRIAEANLILNGITMIVGDNNMGKTTSGRVLYTFFNSLYRIDREVDSQRKTHIKRLIRRFFEKYRRTFSDYSAIHEIIDHFLSDREDKGDEIREFIYHRLAPRASLMDIKGLLGSLVEVRDWSNTSVRKQIILDYFERVFSDQLVSVDFASEGASIHGEVEGHHVKVNFLGKDVSYESDINIQHQAFFVDSPDILNYWGRYRYMGAPGSSSALSLSLRRGVNLALIGDDNPADRAFENLMFAERYNKFASEVAEIMGGHFEFDNTVILRFVEAREGVVNTPSFDLDNVSEGLKAFGVIELMLKYRVFNDGDILIFDEPEIHLHPEWQIKYASILVKLQKEFNLTVLITTHSSNFLMALQFVSRMENRAAVVNSYRIRESNQNSRYSVVESDNPNNWDDSYISFIRAAQHLNVLREKAYAGEVADDSK